MIIYVHKYKWSHDKRRRKYKKLYKKGKVELISRVARRDLILTPTINHQGRALVSCKDGGNWRAKQVSKLVADAFLTGEGLVLHQDDCPSNNRVTNLRYGDMQDNHDDALLNGRRAFNGVRSLKVLSIVQCGYEETYDIEVAHEDHNFIAENLCTHNSYNELSARYKELPEEVFIPAAADIGVQSDDNKQMRTGDYNHQADFITGIMSRHAERAFKDYHRLIKMGCPRELARTVLPLGTYSHMFCTANLHNWFGFLRERLHPTAQPEIRVYAEAILELIEPIAPVAVGAFRESL